MTVIRENSTGACFVIAAKDDELCSNIPSISDYINALNDDYTASVMINKDAAISTPDVKGVFAGLSDNEFGVILGNEFNPLIYRGLNNDLCFMPTSLRYELFDGKERVRHSIERIKKQEFLSLISQTPYLQRTKTFKIFNKTYKTDLESIAKLYNFVSDSIDVTRDILIAYFYAYTYIDYEKKMFLPVTDFSSYSPTLYVGNISRIYNELPNCIKNISMQPFVRAKIQQTMSLNASTDFDRLKDLFVKVGLPRNPEIAEYIYNRFDGGKTLLPGDSAAKFAAKIRNDMTLSFNLFKQYCDETDTDAKWLREQLIKLGYEFSYLPRSISEDELYMINREIDEIIIPYLETDIKLRTIN